MRGIGEEGGVEGVAGRLACGYGGDALGARRFTRELEVASERCGASGARGG